VEMQIHTDVMHCLRETVPCKDLHVSLSMLRRNIADSVVTLWADHCCAQILYLVFIFVVHRQPR